MFQELIHPFPVARSVSSWHGTTLDVDLINISSKWPQSSQQKYWKYIRFFFWCIFIAITRMCEKYMYFSLTLWHPNMKISRQLYFYLSFLHKGGKFSRMTLFMEQSGIFVMARLGHITQIYEVLMFHPQSPWILIGSNGEIITTFKRRNKEIFPYWVV